MSNQNEKIKGCSNYEVIFTSDFEYKINGEKIVCIPIKRPIGDYCSKYQVYNPRCDKCRGKNKSRKI